MPWCIAFAVTVLLVGFAGFGLVDGLVLHPHSMSAVLLVFIPFYQIVIFGSVFLLLLLVRWISRRRVSGA